MSKGNNFQSDVNCKCKSHWGALNCHGISHMFSTQFRGLAEIVKEFMEYIADSPLLAHNAYVGTIWSQLGCTGFPPRLSRSGWLELARFACSQAKIERGSCYRLSSDGARQSRLECTRLLHLSFNARGMLTERASRAHMPARDIF